MDYNIPLLVFFLVTTTLLIWYFRKRKKSNSVKLFKEGLKDENSGEFAAAIKQYENAINEAQKNGLNDQLRSLIIEKMKVLHTIVEYEKETRLQADIIQFRKVNRESI